MSLNTILIIFFSFGLQFQANAQKYRIPPHSSDDNFTILENAVTAYEKIFQMQSNFMFDLDYLMNQCKNGKAIYIYPSSEEAVDHNCKVSEDNLYNCDFFKFKSELIKLKNILTPHVRSESSNLEISAFSCMKTAMGKKTGVNQIRIEISKLRNTLNSGLYDDVASFRDTLLDKLNIISEKFNNVEKYISNMIDSYSKQHVLLLLKDFSGARAAGILSGSIKGTCLHLKGAIEGQRIAFSIKNIITSYLYWSKFLDKLKGYRLVADALRAECPDDMKPADYGPFEAEVEAFAKTLFTPEWIVSECKKTKVSEYLKGRCEGTIVVDSYMRAALEQVGK